MSNSSSRSQLLPNLAGIFAAIPIWIGINGLLKPRETIASVDYPVHTTPEAQKLADALTRLFAGRNISLGLVGVAIWYRGDRKLLGWGMLFVSFVPLVDALVSLDLIGRGLWYHLPFMAMALGLGAGLLA